MKLLAKTNTVPRGWLLIFGAAICLILLIGISHRGLSQGLSPYDAKVVQTNGDLSQALAPLADLSFGKVTVGNEPVITVNASVRYQRVKGFGAAMTDSAAWLIERKTSRAARDALMNELFGATGIHLDFVRVPMGASDFTHDGQPYSYDDLPSGQSDPGLRHFSIAHDQAYILPALRQALVLDPATEFLAGPWSPPAWMKTNDSLGNVADAGSLRASAYRPWGQYFAKYIQAYAKAGVPVGAVTLQNEPAIGTIYPGLNISAANQATWVLHDLEPALARARLHTKIYGGDLGWGPTTTYVSSSAFGPAGRAMAGLAWHCYFGSPGVMARFHNAAPRLDQIIDECSPGHITHTPISEVVISGLREWASAVSLWNLALDPSGGPAELPNHGCMGCQGLVTINQGTGAVSLNQAYYELGQASSFVAPGAQRISSTHFVSYTYPRSGVNVVTPGLDDVALRNPDGSIVLVAYNNSAGTSRFAVKWRGRALRYALAPRATVTFDWNRR